MKIIVSSSSTLRRQHFVVIVVVSSGIRCSRRGVMESSLEIDFFVVGIISSLSRDDVDRQLLPGSNPSLLLPEYDDPVVTPIAPSESSMTTTVGIVFVVDDDEDDRGP